jgi:hypothetical protein
MNTVVSIFIISMIYLPPDNKHPLGLPFSTKNLPHLLARGSPPRLRNRERSSQRPAARSLTPPPLPKSASLPLHTARTPSSSVVDRPSAQPLLQTQSSHTPDPVRLSSVPSRSPSTLFDQSPRIAEVLRQITHAKTIVLDFRTQLTDCQQCASHSHALLQGEVDSFRDRKRKEDTVKLELKSRTKALDDSKRAAESTKKDAEKKLKAAQNARDNATQRMGHLDKEISKLQQQLAEDDAVMLRSKGMLSEAEQEITDALEHKKLEIKVAEDVVIALNQRARDLEDRLSEEKGKLARLKERNETRKQDRSLRPSQISSQHISSTPWPSTVHAPHGSIDVPSSPEIVERQQALTGFDVMSGLGRRPSIPHDTQTSSRPNTLSLGSLSNFHSHPSTTYPTANNTQAALRANGYSVFDDSMVAVPHHQILTPHHTTNFSPFGDSEASQPRGVPGIGSPTSQSLIPSNLITPISDSDGLSRSFQSDSDVYMDKEWRGFGMAPYTQQHHRAKDNATSGFATVTTSPVSLHGPSSDDFELDSFGVRFGGDHGHDHQMHHRLGADNPLDSQRTSWLHRTNSDPNHYMIDFNHSNSTVMEKAGPRRWFSTKEKPKKGLNPDAKVFSLDRKSPPRAFAPGSVFNEGNHGIPTSYDALNPNGLGSKAMPAPASANNSLLRAFAPSPAEREALQRALGGSTNTSFERLPSLSDVGSIPSSPSHVHAHPANHVPQHSARELGKVLPSWLQSLPRIRKANFSPWDDEEPASVGVTSGNGSGVKRR